MRECDLKLFLKKIECSFVCILDGKTEEFESAEEFRIIN